MIDQLQSLIQTVLPKLLAQPDNCWNTLDITYEDPHVERVWCAWGELRINLHRIHPCEKSLYHPHTVPSATWLAAVPPGGHYEMRTGTEHEIVSTVHLTSDAYYEMVDIKGWHSVRPVGGPVMSVFLTGPPWNLPADFPRFGFGRGIVHRPLSEEKAGEILRFFRDWLNVPRPADSLD